MDKTTKIIIGVIIAILVIGGIWYGMSRKPAKKETIKIGAILPLSGDKAIYGNREKNGLGLALGEINGNGGVNGKKIELIFEDTKGDATGAVNAVNKLLDIDKVSTIIGCLSNEISAIAPITEEKKIILFAPIAASRNVSKTKNYIFGNRESAEMHGAKIAEFVKGLGINKAAVLYLNAENGITYAEGFIKRYGELGGEIIYRENYNKGEKDHRTYLLKIKSQRAEAIYIPGYGEDIGLILKQAEEIKINSRFFSSPGIEIPNLFNIAGASAEGVIYSIASFNPTNPLTADYSAAYKERYGEESDWMAANSYDALKILADAMKSCHSYKDNDCVKDFILNLRDYNGVGGLTTFDKNGDVIKPIALKTIKNGQFVPYSE